MTQDFDPYYEWLGIPPKDQPPHYYRLLGIEPLESNVNVIANAADRQMRHVRSFQSGPRSRDSQRLLTDLAMAKVCLLDPEKKSDYDARLDSLGITTSDEPTAATQPADDAGFDVAAFGEYVLLDLLGKGGTGQVFKARHRTLDRLVALKILSTEAMQSEKVVARFRRKVRILARIRHPNIVEAYDAGEKNGFHYLAMEYVDGQELAALAAQFHPLPVEYVVGYVLQAAAGLACAHAHGVCHRNIKPRNLLVDKHGVVKVIGLGLAKDELDRGPGGRDQITQQGAMIGTLDYMAPEQIADSSTVDHRADIYGLACTLYVLLAAKLPYPVKSPMQKALAHRKAAVPNLQILRPDVSNSLQQVFARMMAKQPAGRFQSMDEVIAALQAIQQDLVNRQATAPPPQPPTELDQFLSWMARREGSGDPRRDTWTDNQPPL